MSDVTAEQSTSTTPPPRRRHRRRPRKWLIGAIGSVVLLLVIGVSWYEVHVHPFGGPGPPVTIHVTTGESYTAVTAAMAQDGVISDGFSLKVFNLIHGTPTVLPGFYTLPKNSTFQAAHDVLASGPNTTALVIPSGFTLKEVVARLKSEVSVSYASATATALSDGSVQSPYAPAGTTNLEGLIAPGTYLIPPSLTPKALVQTMVMRFNHLAASAGLLPSTTYGGLNSYQLVTVASVVEKEGYITANMPKVARVIFNRLAVNMPLQMDATVLYALGQDGGPVNHATESYRSPYNSYLNHGLPPTPICTASKAALEATVNPTPGTWLYFTLVEKSGTEAFASTFQEQLANEKIAASRGL